MIASGAGELEVASVLFMDLVGYSRHSMGVQRDLLGRLENAVQGSSIIQRAQGQNDLIQIPTGDGMALVFFHDPTEAALCAVEIGREARKTGLDLRMGLHAGPVYRVTDINEQQNVSGGGINFAQRVMDCGDAGHILVSGAMAEMLNQVGGWAERLKDLGEQEVKHGARLRIFNLSFADVGNPAMPERLRRRDTGLQFLGQLRTRAGAKRGIGTLIVAGLIVLTAGTATWWRYARPGVRPSDEALKWYQEGLSAIRDGTYLRAAKALERAASLSPGAPIIQARLAEAWNELDSPQRAGEAMLRIAPGTSESLGRIDALTVQAVRKTLINDYAGAVRDLDEIARLAAPAEKAFALVDAGRGFEKANNPRKALEYYNQATQLAPNYAGALLHQAILQARFQNRKAATASFDAAEVNYEASSNLEGATEVLLRRGENAIIQKDSDEARRFLERALQLAQTASNPSQEVQILLKLSAVDYNSGHMAESEKRASDAIERSRTAGVDNLTARAIIDLGTALFVRGEFQRAQRYFEEGLSAARRYQNRRAEAAALYMLGNLGIRLRHSESGAKLVEQALTFYRTNGFQRDAAQCLMLLGRFERDQGHYQQAAEMFRDHLRLATDLSDRSLTAFAHENLGSVLLRQDRFPEALDHLEKNYEIVKSLNDPVRLAYASVQRGAVLWQLGRSEEASSLMDSVSTSLTGQEAHQSLAPNIRRIRAQIALSRREYAQAIALARPRGAAEGRNGDDFAEISQVLCLALARSGQAREALRVCQRTVELATADGDPKVVATARLSQLEARLKTDAPLVSDFEAQAAVLDRLGCLEARWWARRLEAEAARKRPDQAAERRAREQANEALAELKKTWGDEAFTTYSRRPDVAQALRGLGN